MKTRSLGLALLVCMLATPVAAQIDRPGAHIKYSAEVEPHLVLQWDDETWWGDEGIGVGIRGSIPLIDNGPVKTINNNMGIGFGFDWVHFDDPCGPVNNLTDDCAANDFWIPVVVQWNFFFSDLISAFPELGLAIQHSRWEAGWCQRGNNVFSCGDGSDTDLELVLWLGVRFHLGDSFALTLRLGTPSLILGAAFFL